MKKPYLNILLIVEGKSDQAFISSFFETNFLLTNGYDIKKEDINFIKKVKEIMPIVVLTDSDEAGKNIREKLNKEISGLVNEFIDINFCNKNNKHGVAESNQAILYKLLEKYIDKNYMNKNYVLLNDLYSLSNENKIKLINHYDLGYCTNNKQLIKRINLLGISLNEIYNYLGNSDGNK